MRRNSRSHGDPISLRNYRGVPVEIAMNRHVPGFMCRELSRYPECEEGGKYIGFIDKDREKTRIIIMDFLPGGPNAKRTRVEFFPDGEFQEKLFRQAERLNEAIEHLGSWHSHHCNGLRTLSGGDIEGYFRTLNKRSYRPDFFLASLVTEVPSGPQEEGWLHHYLFLVDDHNFYSVTNEVALADMPNPFGGITGHPDVGDDSQSGQATSSHFQGTGSGRWYESEVGRQTLAEDRKFFTDKFGQQMWATRTQGRIKMTGMCPNGAQISMVYPVAGTDSTVQISVIHKGRDVVKMSCELDIRQITLSGALKIAGLL